MLKVGLFGSLGLLSSEFVQVTFTDVTASEVVKCFVQLAIGIITIYSLIKKTNNKK